MRVLRTMIGLSLLLAVGLAMAGKVNVEFDPNADFSPYRHYAWKKGTPAATPGVQEIIEKEIDEALQELGLQKVSAEEADFYVVSYAVARTGGTITGGYFYSPTWNIGVMGVDPTTFTDGTLAIDMLDKQSEKTLWRGWITEGIKADTLPKIERKVEKMVAKLFKKLPGR